MKKETKMGRPKLENDVRSVRFIVRLNQQEREELDRKAKKNNVSSAEYIRQLIKKDK